MKQDNSDITDAVGDLILNQKKKRALYWQAKVVGWLIVALVGATLLLIFTKVAS